MRLSRKLGSFASVLAMLVYDVNPLGAVQKELPPHTFGVGGMPHGVPLLCAEPSAVSETDGGSSDPGTWSTQQIPSTNNRIRISASHSVTYDVHAEVRGSVLEIIDIQASTGWLGESISINWGTRPRDAEPRDPISVYDYNKQPGMDFTVYYSYEAPLETAPCHDTVPGIGGGVCD